MEREQWHCKLSELKSAVAEEEGSKVNNKIFCGKAKLILKKKKKVL
jgi:hypothetical protein